MACMKLCKRTSHPPSLSDPCSRAAIWQAWCISLVLSHLLIVSHYRHRSPLPREVGLENGRTGWHLAISLHRRLTIAPLATIRRALACYAGASFPFHQATGQPEAATQHTSRAGRMLGRRVGELRFVNSFTKANYHILGYYKATQTKCPKCHAWTPRAQELCRE
jgi:hypothetical protein